MSTLTPRQAAANAFFPRSDFLVGFAHRYVCCALPKNGCTTIKRWHLHAAEGQPPAPGAPIHRLCFERHNLHCHRGEAERCLRDFFCFTFVRDPLRRIASAFRDKFVSSSAYGYDLAAREAIEDVARSAGRDVRHDLTVTIKQPHRTVELPASSVVDYARGITFREFVRWLSEASDDHLDHHWRPQAASLAGHRFDFVGRVEHLSSCLPAIARMLGAPVPDVAAEHTPKSDGLATDERLTDIPCGHLFDRRDEISAQSLYTPELRRAILRRFEEDVELYLLARPLPGLPSSVSAPPRPAAAVRPADPTTIPSGCSPAPTATVPAPELSPCPSK